MLFESKMCDTSVNTCHCTIQFVLDCYKTQEMCDKAVNKCFLAFIYILDWYKTGQMCDRAIYEDPFMLVYCPENIKLREFVMIVWKH